MGIKDEQVVGKKKFCKKKKKLNLPEIVNGGGNLHIPDKLGRTLLSLKV